MFIFHLFIEKHNSTGRATETIETLFMRKEEWVEMGFSLGYDNLGFPQVLGIFFVDEQVGGSFLIIIEFLVPCTC